MNKRIAEKIVKKYGMSWLVEFFKEINGTWVRIGKGWVIPPRWKNKTIEKLMEQRYGWTKNI